MHLKYLHVYGYLPSPRNEQHRKKKSKTTAINNNNYASVFIALSCSYYTRTCRGFTPFPPLGARFFSLASIMSFTWSAIQSRESPDSVLLLLRRTSRSTPLKSSLMKWRKKRGEEKERGGERREGRREKRREKRRWKEEKGGEKRRKRIKRRKKTMRED